MKRPLIVSIVLAAAALLPGCGGKETIIREVYVTSPTSIETTTTTTRATVPKKNKYESYLEDLKDFSGKANTQSDSDLIEIADLVCEAFDNDATLDQVIAIFAEYAEGTSDYRLYAGIISSAVVNICPEHTWVLSSLS